MLIFTGSKRMSRGCRSDVQCNVLTTVYVLEVNDSTSAPPICVQQYRDGGM